MLARAGGPRCITVTCEHGMRTWRLADCHGTGCRNAANLSNRLSPRMAHVANHRKHSMWTACKSKCVHQNRGMNVDLGRYPCGSTDAEPRDVEVLSDCSTLTRWQQHKVGMKSLCGGPVRDAPPSSVAKKAKPSWVGGSSCSNEPALLVIHLMRRCHPHGQNLANWRIALQ